MRLGNNIGARPSFQNRLALPQAETRRRRGGQFLLCDTTGRVLYSQDGFTWKASTSGVAIAAGLGKISAGWGAVVVSAGDGGATVPRFTHNLRTWANLPGAPAGGVANILCGMISTQLTGLVAVYTCDIGLLQNDSLSGTSHSPLSQDPESPLIVSTGNIFQMDGGGQITMTHDLNVNFGRHGGVFIGDVILGANISTNISMNDAHSFADLTNGGALTWASLGLPGTNVGACAAKGHGQVILPGDGGGLAINRGDLSFEAASVGFTGNRLEVALFNGEAFVVAGVGGVVGVSYDGRDWKAASTGFANDVVSGAVSDTILTG